MTGRYEDMLETNRFSSGLSPEYTQDLPAAEKARLRQEWEHKRRAAAKQLLEKQLRERIDRQYDALDMVNTNRYEGSGTESFITDLPEQFRPGFTFGTDIKDQGPTTTTMTTAAAAMPGNLAVINAQQQVGGNKQRNRVTYVNIDTRDRDRATYANTSSFRVELPREFENVQRIRLAGLEFPIRDFGVRRGVNDDLVRLTTSNTTLLTAPLTPGTYDWSTMKAELERNSDVNGSLFVEYNEAHGLFHTYFLGSRPIISPYAISGFTGANTEISIANFSGRTVSHVTFQLLRDANNQPAGLVEDGFVHFEQFTDNLAFLNGMRRVMFVQPCDVANTNNTVRIDETSAGGSDHNVTITNGTYRSRAGLLTEVQRALNAAATTDVRYDVYLDEIDRVLIRSNVAVDMRWTDTANSNLMLGYVADTLGNTVHRAQGFIPSRAFGIELRQIELDNLGNLASSMYMDGNVWCTPALAQAALCGEYATTPAGVLGLPPENTSGLLRGKPFLVPSNAVLTSASLLTLTIANHGLQTGDRVRFRLIRVFSTSDVNLYYNTYAVQRIDADTVTIDTSPYLPVVLLWDLTSYPIKLEVLTTEQLTAYTYTITEVAGTFPSATFTVTTDSAHHLVVGDRVRFGSVSLLPQATDTTEYEVTAVPSSTSVTVQTLLGDAVLSVAFTAGTSTLRSNKLLVRHHFHQLETGNHIRLYNVRSFAGIPAAEINNARVAVTVINEDSYYVAPAGAFASRTETGGGTEIYCYGEPTTYGQAPWRRYGRFPRLSNVRKQDAPDWALDIYSPPNFAGEQYVFITCPTLQQLGIRNQYLDRQNKDAFAKVLVNSANSSYTSNDIVFIERMVPRLTSLDFELRYRDGSLFDTRNRDWSMTLEITEVLNIVTNSGLNSRTNRLDHVFTT